jgi:DNA-binding transcriptional LysR family regulator
MNDAAPDWSLFRSFLAVLKEGSLLGAANALGLTQPTLARHIDALEKSLGIELFTRSRQGLAPTEAALELKPYAESLAATTAAMTRVASGHGQSIKGTIRISASEMIGAEVLPTILSTLREQHPALEVELILSNAVDNLLRRDADIAVRMVEPVQEALVVRRLGTISLGLHAHRHYLERAGRPRDLKHLADFALIGYDRETPAVRSLRKQAPQFDFGRFALRTDSDIAQLMAIRAGFGIGICQIAIAKRDPNLERLLPRAFELKMGTWLAMHENLRNTRRYRIVFDTLATGLKEHVD